MRSLLVACAATAVVRADYLISLTSSQGCPDIGNPAASTAFVQYPENCLTDGVPGYNSGNVVCVNSTSYREQTFVGPFCEGTGTLAGPRPVLPCTLNADNTSTAQFCVAGRYTAPATTIVGRSWDLGGYNQTCVPPGIPTMFVVTLAPGMCVPYPQFVSRSSNKYARVSCTSDNTALLKTTYANPDCSDAGNASVSPLCVFNSEIIGVRTLFSCPVAAPPAAAAPVAAIVVGVLGAAVVAAVVGTLVFVKSLRDALVRRLCNRESGEYKAMTVANTAAAYAPPQPHTPFAYKS